MTTGPADPNSPQYGYPAGYPPPTAPGLRPAGRWVRFFARLIDGIIVNIVAFLISLFLLHNDYWFLATGLFSGVLTFGYFVLFEVTQGSSPGKKLLGLAVRGPGGAPKPNVKQSAIRNAFTLFAVIPYFGGLLVFIAMVVIAVTIGSSPTKQGQHDELAGGTQVVRA
jgi:uncharacterized RDD family membrane protein YckC